MVTPEPDVLCHGNSCILAEPVLPHGFAMDWCGGGPQVAPALLLHPCCAVRGAVVEFVAAASRELPAARAYAQLLPHVLPACASEPLSLQDPALLSACLRPGASLALPPPPLSSPPPLSVSIPLLRCLDMSVYTSVAVHYRMAGYIGPNQCSSTKPEPVSIL